MKFVRINIDDTMCDCTEDINLRNIKKVMRQLSSVSKIRELYEWPYENGFIRCYGNTLGKAGQENKHDLPGSGKKIHDLLDNSDTQLLFNDIFLVRFENNKLVDFDISDYGLFYTLCFEGFDECNTDDETEDDDEVGSLEDFIVEEPVSDSDSSYEMPDTIESDDDYDSDEELDEDVNEY